MPEAVAEYVRCFSCSSTIHSTCEDFRASADINLEMDQADDREGNKTVAPVHFLLGAGGNIANLWDVLSTWWLKASSTFTGCSFGCGHFLQEECPDDTIEEFQNFRSERMTELSQKTRAMIKASSYERIANTIVQLSRPLRRGVIEPTECNPRTLAQLLWLQPHHHFLISMSSKRNRNGLLELVAIP